MLQAEENKNIALHNNAPDTSLHKSNGADKK